MTEMTPSKLQNGLPPHGCDDTSKARIFWLRLCDFLEAATGCRGSSVTACPPRTGRDVRPPRQSIARPVEDVLLKPAAQFGGPGACVTPERRETERSAGAACRTICGKPVTLPADL
jgi:hypothetical protein